MERFMYQDDDSFERMLKQKADEYRMYPSNQIWDNIQKRVQKKNSLLNIKSAGLTIVLLSTFSLYISSNQEAYTEVSLSSFVANNLNKEQATDQPSAVVARNKVRFQPYAESIAVTVIQLPATKDVTLSADADQSLIETKPVSPVIDLKPTTATEELVLNKAENHPVPSTSTPDLTISSAPIQTTQLSNKEQPAELALSEEPSALKTDAELNYEVNIPVVVKRKEAKQLQFYIAPSASYRVLYEGNRIAFGNLSQQSPENAAKHFSSLGLEAGAAILFPVSKRVKFRTAIQFNYTHYIVNAYNSAPQLTTIRLNYSSIQRVSTLNSNFGYNAEDLANETFQISIPIGLEIKLAGKKKVQWNLATDVQPTYLLKATGYLLTNDLKNYVKAPDLLSRLNLNSSLGTFIRWNAKNIMIQAGPQVRYQIFSNTRGEYPIKEHLVDYGFRIGIIKPLR